MVRVKSRRKPITDTNSMGLEVPINRATDNAEDNAQNVGDPVIQIGALVEVGLDGFDHLREDTYPNKH